MRQVDTLVQDPQLHGKGERAGGTKVFIGLEEYQPDTLAASEERQNRSPSMQMLLAWKKKGI